MLDINTNRSLNDTLEEELRLLLIQSQKDNSQLRGRVKTLEHSVREEQEAKYNAYKRIAELNDDVKNLEAKLAE